MRTVKKVSYEMRVISIPLFVCLFVCFADSFVGLFSLSANSHMLTSIHACTHAICVKRFGRKKGLIHYFLALIGAWKRIRRGKLSDGGARKYHLGREPSGSVK